jgi:hypothetical protein
MSNKQSKAHDEKVDELDVSRLLYRAYSYVEWQRIHEAATDPRKTRGVVHYLNRLSECGFTDVPDIARFHKIAWNLVRRTERVNVVV